MKPTLARGIYVENERLVDDEYVVRIRAAKWWLWLQVARQLGVARLVLGLTAGRICRRFASDGGARSSATQSSTERSSASPSDVAAGD